MDMDQGSYYGMIVTSWLAVFVYLIWFYTVFLSALYLILYVLDFKFIWTGFVSIVYDLDVW